MHPDARFNQAADNNKDVILTQLRRILAQSSRVFEIASGTGQHAVHFARQLSHLTWHTSELADNHGSIRAWMAMHSSANVEPPVVFDLAQDSWPEQRFDGAYTANTAHILPPELTRTMMQLVASNLLAGGVFCQYGPFRIDGEYTTQSNANFDQHLLQQGYGGIRDIAELQQWGSTLILEERIAMPANNFLLVWRQSD